MFVFETNKERRNVFVGTAAKNCEYAIGNDLEMDFVVSIKVTFSL